MAAPGYEYDLPPAADLDEALAQVQQRITACHDDIGVRGAGFQQEQPDGNVVRFVTFPRAPEVGRQAIVGAFGFGGRIVNM